MLHHGNTLFIGQGPILANRSADQNKVASRMPAPKPPRDFLENRGLGWNFLAVASLVLANRSQVAFSFPRSS